MRRRIHRVNIDIFCSSHFYDVWKLVGLCGRRFKTPFRLPFLLWFQRDHIRTITLVVWSDLDLMIGWNVQKETYSFCDTADLNWFLISFDVNNDCFCKGDDYVDIKNGRSLGMCCVLILLSVPSLNCSNAVLISSYMALHKLLKLPWMYLLNCVVVAVQKESKARPRKMCFLYFRLEKEWLGWRWVTENCVGYKMRWWLWEG